MDFTVLNNNIILNIDHINPLVINRSWLVNNNIISDDKINDNSIFHDHISQVSNEDFIMTIVQNQIQFNFQKNESLNTIIKILTKINDVFKISSFGINFIHNIEWTDSVEKKTEKYFTNVTETFFDNFKSDNSKFGSYISYDFKLSRLKLNIQPSIIQIENNQTNKYLTFNFNFHVDSVELKYDDIINEIKSWNEYEEFSNKITKSF